MADRNDNIYAAIVVDTIDINNKIYQGEISSIVLVKFNGEGEIAWTNHILANSGGQCTPVLAMYYPKQNCPAQVLLTDEAEKNIIIEGDTILNDSFRTYLLEFTSDGTIARHKTFEVNNKIWKIQPVNEKIFLNANIYDPLGKRYHGHLLALNELLEITNKKKIATPRLLLHDLQYDAEIGLIIAGEYDTLIDIEGHVQDLDYQPSPSSARGSVIATYDEQLKLGDVRFIKGGRFSLGYILPWNNKLIGFGYSYSEVTNYFNNDKITEGGTFIFKTFPLSKIWKNDTLLAKLSGKVYPNPFKNSCIIKFDRPLYGYIYNVYNSIGQLCDKAEVQVMNNVEVVVDMTGMPGGIYVLRMHNCCDESLNLKLIKQ